MTNPTQITWTDPTTNVDGTPIDPAGTEITGFAVGVRSATDPASVAGTYPFTASAPANATSALLSALSAVLPPDNYFAAVQTLSTSNGNSAWSAESNQFTIAAPVSPPNPPSNVQVA